MTANELAMMQVTMDIVAEKGLDGFSMKQVTNRLGVSEALLYKYFESKENLLLQCFLSVNRQIADLFTDVKMPAKWNIPARMDFIHQQWERYFRFMVNNGNRSLFYYTYRDSNCLQAVLMRNNPEVAADMLPFMNLSRSVAKGLLNSKVPADYIWVYLLEGTGIFVKHAIREHYALEDIDIDSIWLLISGGVKSLLR